MRAQYKGIPIPTFTWKHYDNSFILVDINDAALEASQGELFHSLGRKIEDIEYGNLEDMASDLKLCWSEKRLIKKETNFRNRITGMKRIVAVSYAFVPPDLVLMHAEDITERKLTDDLLHLQRELAVALSSTSDLAEALNKILETVCQIPGFDSGRVYLVDRNSGEINLAVHKGLSLQFVEKVSHYNSDDPSALLIQAGKPVFMSYSNVLPEIKNGVRMNEGLRATAIIPIIYEGQIMAALNLASHSTDEISDRTRSAIEGIAAQTGEAIARLRAEVSLYESQKNFQSLIDTVDDFVFILNREGCILRSNPVVRNGWDIPLKNYWVNVL
ncbi:MAG: GAF domain-containing protein [Anaerolineales bacterium]|nr:GAF domain-containing protein [Anaerolineales bacterium]